MRVRQMERGFADLRMSQSVASALRIDSDYSNLLLVLVHTV